MATSHSTGINRNGARPKYVPLGTDAFGASHVYRTTDRTVHVVLNGERTKVERLGERQPESWMNYVADKRGWAQRQYGQSLVDILMESIDGGR